MKIFNPYTTTDFHWDMRANKYIINTSFNQRLLCNNFKFKTVRFAVSGILCSRCLRLILIFVSELCQFRDFGFQIWRSSGPSRIIEMWRTLTNQIHDFICGCIGPFTLTRSHLANTAQGANAGASAGAIANANIILIVLIFCWHSFSGVHSSRTPGATSAMSGRRSLNPA